MIKFTNPDNLVWRSYAASIILVLITTAIIIAVLPRTQGKMYHYDEGKPWLYEQLIAKFDFPIFKSEETLKSERDSLMKSFVPYFNLLWYKISHSFVISIILLTFAPVKWELTY